MRSSQRSILTRALMAGAAPLAFMMMGAADVGFALDATRVDGGTSLGKPGHDDKG